MPVYGWAGTRARLRVIDPPDFSPYVPDNKDSHLFNLPI